MNSFHKSSVLLVLAVLAIGIVFIVTPYEPRSRTPRPSPTNPSENRQITIQSPEPSSVVTSPLTIRGDAEGGWYFEGVFPIRLLDRQGNELSQASARAQGDWMTEQAVPFEATLVFTTPSSDDGSLLFEKSNPSGLDENSGYYTLPVRFR